MRMRARNIVIDVDQISEVVDIGELVKFAVHWRFGAVVEPGSPELGESSKHVVRLSREDRSTTSADVDLATLAMIYAYVHEKSGDEVLADIRQQFVDRCFPLNRPIQDEMSVGGGPEHDGHDHS